MASTDKEQLKKSFIYYIHQGLNGWNEKSVLEGMITSVDKYEAALKQELKQSLEAEIEMGAHNAYFDYENQDAVSMEHVKKAFEIVFQDKGDNRE